VIGHTGFTESSNGYDLQAVLKSIFIPNGNVKEKLSTNVFSFER
jgi:hypothetical protein